MRAIVNKRAYASRISRTSTLRFRAVSAPDGNLEGNGKYFNDSLYSRADVKAPVLGLAFWVDGETPIRPIKLRAQSWEMQKRELAGLNREPEANLRNEKRRRGNITFVRIHAPASLASRQRLRSMLC